MKTSFRTMVLTVSLAAMLPMAAQAATATMKSPEGKDMGVLNLVQTGDGVRITGAISGLSAGEHAFHIHAAGKCKAPFKSAGGHYNPLGLAHGKRSLGGLHAGDMDNITAGDDGGLKIDILNARVTLNAPATGTLFDADGSAIVIHAGADDYTSQPSGAAGARVACGVIN